MSEQALDTIPGAHAVGMDGESKPSRFAVLPASKFMQQPPPTWFIKDVLPCAPLVVLYGESGAGKSFIALDMVAAISRGIDWCGHRTQQGRVVYVVAEGAGGFRNRMCAYARHHGAPFPDPSFGLINAAPNLLQKDDVRAVIMDIKDFGGADLVVIDTFAQVTPGANENAAEDMGRALSHCKAIHEATGATVMLVHHAGKDSSRGMRGWSGLQAAADSVLEVTKKGTARTLSIIKQKDGDTGQTWGFALLPVEIDDDEDGEPIRSCVVQTTGITISEISRKRGKWERRAAKALSDRFKGEGTSVEVSSVVDAMVQEEPAPEPGKRDRRQEQARRALESVCVDDGYVIEGDHIRKGMT